MEFPAVDVAAAVENWPGTDSSILSFNTPQLGEFSQLHKKALYIVAVKVHHQAALRGVRALRWLGDLGLDSSLGGCWRSVYKPPVILSDCSSQ